MQLSFYPSYPEGEVPTADYETWATNRFQVLSSLETITRQRLPYSEYRAACRQLINNFFPDDPIYTRADHVSHFALRWVFCRSPEDQKWFISQETELLRYRLSLFHPSQWIVLMNENGWLYDTLSSRVEKESILPYLECQDPAKLFCVPWIEALEVVGRKMCPVINGEAIVEQGDFTTIVCARFRKILLESLELYREALPQILEDDRMRAVCERIQRPRPVVSVAGAPVPLQHLDEIVEKHFPPCMRRLHHMLRHDHHLNNSQRMHYGLFLKKIGVSREDHEALFREEFVTRGFTADESFKEHAYNINHMHEKDYFPYGCGKLKREGSCYIPDIEDIVLDGHLQQGRFQHACRRYYMLNHPGAASSSLIIDSPSNYFFESFNKKDN